MYYDNLFSRSYVKKINLGLDVVGTRHLWAKWWKSAPMRPVCGMATYLGRYIGEENLYLSESMDTDIMQAI